MKKLNINTGTALLLNERSAALEGYDRININCGNAVISRKVNSRLLELGVSINSGNMSVIDISGELVEVAPNTVITSRSSFNGCFVFCNGNLIIEDAGGLADITGLYAESVFHPESVNLNRVRGITATRRIVYADDAKLHIGDLTLGDDAYITLDGTLHWIYGCVRALDSGVVRKLREKHASFTCRKLITYEGIYENNADMFRADTFVLIPDGYAYAGDITLDASSAALYGDKLYIEGDLMIAHDQTSHLSDFEALIVKGTATMPIGAIKDFKCCGNADDYCLYAGILMTVNGKDTFSHEHLQTVIKRGVTYTIHVNGVLEFCDDVTAEDIAAITAIHCNGVIRAPRSVRGELDSRIREMNGLLQDIGNTDEQNDTTHDEADDAVTNLNSGVYRL